MEPVGLILMGVLLTCTLVWAQRQIPELSRAGACGPFDGKGPEFDLRQHLNGPLLCEGVIYGPTGRVSSRFVADFEAKWDGNEGWMTERFRYDSGHRPEP
jgi:hypothetical protein